VDEPIVLHWNKSLGGRSLSLTAFTHVVGIEGHVWRRSGGMRHAIGGHLRWQLGGVLCHWDFDRVPQVVLDVNGHSGWCCDGPGTSCGYPIPRLGPTLPNFNGERGMFFGFVVYALTLGPSLQMSIILINLFIGPPLFRLALVRVGETNKGGPLLATTSHGVSGTVGTGRRESAGGGPLEDLEEIKHSS